MLLSYISLNLKCLRPSIYARPCSTILATIHLHLQHDTITVLDHPPFLLIATIRDRARLLLFDFVLFVKVTECSRC